MDEGGITRDELQRDQRPAKNGLEENGAGEAIRTPDPHLGKVMLYP